MVLYKATKDGQIAMTAEEEAIIREDWAKNSTPKSVPLSNDQRLVDLEKRILALEAKQSKGIK